MANAKKCNCCEKCYDPLKIEGVMVRFKNPIFQDAEDVRNNRVKAYMIPDDPDAIVDLCPDCAELFETLMCTGELPEITKKKEEKANAQIFWATQRADKASDEMFKALKRAREAETENDRLRATMERWDEQMRNKQIECNDWREKYEKAEVDYISLQQKYDRLYQENEQLQQDYAKLVHVDEWNDDLGEEIQMLRDENEWLNSLLEFGKEGNLGDLIKKAKNAFMDAMNEMDPEKIKEKVIAGFEQAIFGKFSDEDKCANCRGSREGRCPFGVKPKCDSWKGEE